MLASLHRRLALRLGLGALVVALLAGLATFSFEMEKVDDSVVARASQEADLFARRVTAPLRPENSESATALLNDFIREQQNDPHGRFLMAEAYSQEHEDVARTNEDLPPELLNRLENADHRFPTGDEPWYSKIILDERVFLQVLAPLKDAGGKPLGFFEGVYHVPADQMDEIRNRVAETVGLVVAAVLVTALVLYPLLLGLQREQIQLSKGLLQANIDTLSVLGSAIAKRDSDTHAHNFRVSLYAVFLAQAIGEDPEEIRELIKGAWLHDVGKIAISDTILLKPGKLDTDEFEVMKTHVQHGIDIVSHSDWLIGAAEVVAGHHEKFDGSGYPTALAGEEIPLNARIFALADVFDALTSRRPYKEPMTCQQALAIMEKSRGSHFDPRLFDGFAAIVPPLHAQFGGREDDTARDLLADIGRTYFFQLA